jgi:hypothetical protein
MPGPPLKEVATPELAWLLVLPSPASQVRQGSLARTLAPRPASCDAMHGQRTTLKDDSRSC